jgi:DNA-binding MarR family transcriptional regulator
VPRSKRNARSPYLPAPGATDRQGAFLGAIAELTEELQRAPNATEVAERLGISQPGARKQLRSLEAKGLIQDVPKLVSSGQWAVVKR